MSIINDALKKACGAKKTNDGPAGVPLASESETENTKTSQIHHKNTKKRFDFIAHIKKIPSVPRILIYPSAILLVIVAGLIYLSNRNQHTQITPDIVDSGHLKTGDSIAGRSDINIPSSKTSPEDQETGITLTGIVHGEGSPMAIMNDSVYMTGDTINGFQIKDILNNSVLLERDNNSIELKVK
jgi:hypothetical protein